MRDAYRKIIFPQIDEFSPDIIFISAGFDAHKRDEMNFGYVGMIEEDYEWLTGNIVKLANKHCSGRVVSVLEGGYKIHGGIVSPFCRSVDRHVNALRVGANSKEKYSGEEMAFESTWERGVVEEKEAKRVAKVEKKRKLLEAMLAAKEAEGGEGGGDGGDGGDGGGGGDGEGEGGSPRKRRRANVDYAALDEEMRAKGQ